MVEGITTALSRFQSLFGVGRPGSRVRITAQLIEATSAARCNNLGSRCYTKWWRPGRLWPAPMTRLLCTDPLDGRWPPRCSEIANLGQGDSGGTHASNRTE